MNLPKPPMYWENNIETKKCKKCGRDTYQKDTICVICKVDKRYYKLLKKLGVHDEES